jgi:hypothetical protein
MFQVKKNVEGGMRDQKDIKRQGYYFAPSQGHS